MSRSLIGLAGTVVRINLLGVASSVLGAVAWYVWPSMPEWWGFGVVSIFLALGAFQVLLQALGTAWRMVEQERAIASLNRIGGEAKSSRMAGDDRLRKMGMIDG